MFFLNASNKNKLKLYLQKCSFLIQNYYFSFNALKVYLVTNNDNFQQFQNNKINGIRKY